MRFALSKRVAYWTILIFIIVFVFEETIYGRLGLASTTYLAVKTSTEVFLYLFLLGVLARSAINGRLAKYSPSLFDYMIFIFVLLALVSTVVNGGAITNGILNIRTMLRYVTIYYIIILLDYVPTSRHLRAFVWLIVVLALIQTGIIVVQHMAGDAFRDAYFSPAKVELVLSSTEFLLNTNEQKIGAGYGTFGKPAVASFYLLIAVVLVSYLAMAGNRKYRIHMWFAYAVIVAGIFFTYKRAPLLLAVGVPILMAYILNKKHVVKRYIFLTLLISPLMVLSILDYRPDDYVNAKRTELAPAESLAQLFSKEYWEVATDKSRGWVITEVGKEVLSSFALLGYGADEEHAKAQLAAKGGEFAKLVGWGALDDVYVVAGLVYYGPIGVAIFVLALTSVYKKSKIISSVREPYARCIGVSFAALTILVAFSAFVERIFEFRAFSFIFWVCAGIVSVVYARLPRTRS